MRAPGFGEGFRLLRQAARASAVRRPKMARWTAVVCILMLVCAAAGAPAGTKDVRAEVLGMPIGTGVEVRLKNKQKVRGARGAVSESGFTLVDPKAGERPVAFDDVASVKRVDQKSHTARNILIGVGIGVGAVAVLMITLAHVAGYL